MKFGGIFVALLLSLGACSSDPQPREPQATSSPAPTPTSTATLPSMPEQAREDSPEGAAAFVSYWVEVSNYAAATGDVEELSRISSPDCSGCQKYIDLYEKTYQDGGYFKGGDWELGELQLQERSASTVVFAPVTSPAGKFRLKSGDDESVGEPEDSKLTFIVSRPKASWALDTLELQASA